MSWSLNLFGSSPKPKVSPEDMMKEWKRKLKKEERRLQRDADKLQHSQKDAMKECKKLAKQGNPQAAKLLAKEVVTLRKSIERLYQSKAQINGACMSLSQNMSMMKVQGVLSKSTDVMKAMHSVVKLPELQGTMREMAVEMARAGLIEEMTEEAFDVMDPDLDTVADEEVSKIMEELTNEAFKGTATTAPTTTVFKQPAKTPAMQDSDEVAEDSLDPKEMADIQNRLATL